MKAWKLDKKAEDKGTRYLIILAFVCLVLISMTLIYAVVTKNTRMINTFTEVAKAVVPVIDPITPIYQ